MMMRLRFQSCGTRATPRSPPDRHCCSCYIRQMDSCATACEAALTRKEDSGQRDKRHQGFVRTAIQGVMR